MKISLENTDINFKKFDVSSEKVAKIIEEQMQWKDKKQVGLGYESVPPPFNHNYISTPLTQKEIDREPYMIYGKPAAEQATEPSARVLDTNFSTSNVNVVGLANGKVDFRKKVKKEFAQINFTLLRLENVQTFSERISTKKVEKSLYELVNDVLETTRIGFSTFHSYA
mgnify:CR=1 FL=1